MPEERDAFGNPIEQRAPTGVPGEVPEVDDTPVPASTPRESTAYETARTPAPQGAPGRRVRVGSLGTFSLVLFVLIIVIGAAAIGAVGAFNDVKDVWDDVSSEIDSGNSGAPTDVTGIDGESLFTPANFAEAKQAVAESGLGVPQLASLRPGRLDVQLRNGDDVATVQFKAGRDSLDVLSSTRTAGGLGTFDLTGVPDAAPRRAVVGAAGELGLSTDDIDYIVFMDGPGSGLTMNGYFKGGERFTARASGAGALPAP